MCPMRYLSLWSSVSLPRDQYGSNLQALTSQGSAGLLRASVQA